MRSAKNYIIFALACSTAGAGYFAWQQTRELETLRNAVPANRNLAELRKKIWDNRPSAGLSESENTATANDPPEGNPPATANTENGRRRSGAMQRILDDPDYQTLINLSQKGLLDGRYSALFQSLNLPPRQLEQFKELLVEKQTSLMDVLAAARSQGLDPRTDREAVRQLYATTQAELDASIRSALGDTAYATYKDYERTLPSRNLVGQLGQRLSYSTAPLTNTQSEQLLQIVAETSKPGPASNTANGGGSGMRLGGGNPPLANTVNLYSGGGAIITQETITRAQTILAPVQVAALQDIQQEQQAVIQLGRSMRSEFGARNRPATATPTPVPTP